MASRPILSPFNVITNGSMAASITSAVTVIQNVSMIGYDVVWSAGSTPIGTISVEISNTYSQNADGTVRNAGSWTALPNTAPVSGNSGNGFIDIGSLSSYAIRLKYTRTSGSGTLNVTLNGKVA